MQLWSCTRRGRQRKIKKTRTQLMGIDQNNGDEQRKMPTICSSIFAKNGLTLLLSNLI